MSDRCIDLLNQFSLHSLNVYKSIEKLSKQETKYGLTDLKNSKKNICDSYRWVNGYLYGLFSIDTNETHAEFEIARERWEALIGENRSARDYMSYKNLGKLCLIK